MANPMAALEDAKVSALEAFSVGTARVKPNGTDQ
jgi:hypothetical protein